jgi:diaminopimelate epimerase
MISNIHSFRKMNGLGNDFVVFDARESRLDIGEAAAQRVADRKLGVGCDQVIMIETSANADVFMRIINADGSEVAACGNATRCVAAVLAQETGHAETVIETRAGLLRAKLRPDGLVTVDMGVPRLGWRDIPLARPFANTTSLDVTFEAGAAGVLSEPGAVNVGNPHCIFVVADVDAYDFAEIGPRIERDPLFPERVNVSLAEIVRPGYVKLRVWERGAGLTRACGTAACAAAVALARKGLTGREVTIALPGGELAMEWREADEHILMTGPWSLDYESEFDFSEFALAS